ncbi:B3 domain-containing protein [Quillaja saponaria]|uniref:B3 domain-containing protein n=1 Tax=Quillaja saponaria TaxID=32244 RepID=A0AAD7M039_QUISA|nr:B3 domain-containing protein [Quillaja saponaria]
MVVSKRTYEDCRQQRLEENKRRMEELNLDKLSKSLKASTHHKPSTVAVKPRGTRQPVDLSLVRRSSRFANKPPPNYKDVPLEPLERPRRTYQRRDLLNRVYASDEVRQYAIHGAEVLQSDLDSEYPSFVKPMLQSHVTGGFWLGLPVQFCKTHLPHHDETIALVDEDENESLTRYLAVKTGLSGGWRGFAIDHQLVDGDTLVFQLIKPTTFKVYIIRAYESENNRSNEEDDEELDASHLNRRSKRIRASTR